MSKETGWREGASAELQAAVELAMEQFAFEEQYESTSSTVSETIKSLDKLAIVAWEFATILNELSQVGKSALFEVTKKQRGTIILNKRIFAPIPDLGRFRLDQALNVAVNISSCSEAAKSLIRVSHGSDGPIEQGGGSNRGKDSDIRAIGYDDRFMGVPFRQPKDKFAVRVIEALTKSAHPAAALNVPNSRPLLVAFLDDAWSEMGKQSKSSWTRVVKARHAIAAKVRLELELKEKAAQSRPRWNGAPLED